VNALWFGLSTLLFYIAYWMLVAPLLRLPPLGSMSGMHTILIGLLWGVGLAALLLQPQFRGWGYWVWTIFVGQGVIALPPTRRRLYRGDADYVAAFLAAVLGFALFAYLADTGSVWANKIAAPYTVLFGLSSVGKALLAFILLPILMNLLRAWYGLLKRQTKQDNV